MLTLLLGRSEWAWITVFSASLSQVQSGLRLDRQLETGSGGYQTLRDGGLAVTEMFSSSLTGSGLPEDCQE